jgi:hypothetical protein
MDDWILVYQGKNLSIETLKLTNYWNWIIKHVMSFLRWSPLTINIKIMLSFVIQNEYLNMKY